MKINFPILDEPLSIENGTILVVEEQLVFSDLVKHFYQYSLEDSLKLFDDKFKAIKPAELMLVTDVLGYNINSPAMLKLIYSDIERQLNSKPEVKVMLEKLASTITDLIAFECVENELDLEYDEITLLELIAALGVKIETQTDTIFEKCLEIVQVFKYLTKVKLLVFVNIGSYLSQHEMSKLFEYIELNYVKVLFLEPRKCYDFPQFVLDQDYVLTRENMV